MPAALSSELHPDGSPVRVRLLGEDLVAFRDTDGKVGLIGAFCPHRRAPMFFGRNERNGLRCVYHGWKFDRAGHCTEMPTEPPDSPYRSRIKIESYPTAEGGGIVWTYMGPQDQMPPAPDWELTRAPETHRFVSKTVQDCNWLQALEGGLDSAHAMIMHNSNLGDLSWLNDYDRLTPKLDVHLTDYGFYYSGVRALGARRWARLYQYFMPFWQMRGRVAPLRGAATPPKIPSMCGHAWVPADDVTTTSFNFIYSADPAIVMTHEFAMENEVDDGRGPDQLLPDGRLKANQYNSYFIDRNFQRTGNFTGIEGINTQDVAIQEGMGPIVDRSKEHLGSTDRAIIAMRHLLLDATKAVEAGGMPKGADSRSYQKARAVDLIVEDASLVEDTFRRESVARF
jgi:phenylpropionate dioxygenase-like ring-hydroxylating dioxygenase large terminal subunit